MYSRFLFWLTLGMALGQIPARAAPPGWYGNGPWLQRAGQPESQTPTPGYWSGYRYRPLQQRPGLSPNSSGDPGSSYSYTSPDRSFSYSIQRTPGGYSYSYHLERHSSSTTRPGYGTTPAPSAAANPPWVEASINERRPYVQQNLIYRLLIHNSGNLLEAGPEPPRLDQLVFRQLGQPTTYRAGQSGDLITEYHYLVVPLQAGTLTLPAPRVTGRYRDGSPFEVSGTHPITLYVQPPVEGANPWLPLYDLRLEAHLPEPLQGRAGEPLELEIVTTAVGAVGSQLPAVADQLQSEDFSIYPGEVTESGQISSDGMDLLGTRIERFTLVPRYGGQLKLPAVRLKWWNLRTGQMATAALPERTLVVSGPPRPDAGPATGLSLSPWFWVPLLVVALMVAAGWLGVLLGRGHRPSYRWLTGRLGSPRLPTAVPAWLQRLSPLPQVHRLRRWIGNRLPVSWKLWYCLRAVDRENDPAAWEHALQILAARHLGARTNASLMELAEVITACHPAADAEAVRRLLAQLERANYGGHELGDFAHWKAAFKRQIKPRLFPLRLRSCRARRDEQGGLPRLNPEG